MNNKKPRWVLAQEYEKKWWDDRSDSIDFEFYKDYAEALNQFIKELYTIEKDTNILEIGSGAGGILTYLKESNYRFAIDPLEKFYSTVSKFVEQRDKSIRYTTAKGENLPFKDKMFDLVIIDNVLDHCDYPDKVMKEVKRVMKDEGIIYFKQNTYHLWGKFARQIMEKFLIDKGHPFTFSKKELLKLFSSDRFKIIKSNRPGYYYTWKRELLSNSIKDKVKSLLFITRDKVTYLLKNE
jgi:ubiquinone/menaquinone biosynthesis C-methylase UbiE